MKSFCTVSALSDGTVTAALHRVPFRLRPVPEPVRTRTVQRASSFDAPKDRNAPFTDVPKETVLPSGSVLSGRVFPCWDT